MKDTTPTVTPEPTAVLDLPQERSQFRALLALHPEAFGSGTKPGTKAPFAISNATFYEELACLGFQPDLRRLEAVVLIKRPNGFLGGLCSNGSTEYVRFYLSYDDGATWLDVGLEQFQAHDLPTRYTDGRRLEFALGRTIDTRTAFCLSGHPFALARAILSWNQPPPPNTPGWTPPWGNVVDARIQLPVRRLNLGAILEHTKFKLPEALEPFLDLEAPVAAADLKQFSAAELAVEYKGKAVPAHRFALAEAKSILAGKTGAFASSAVPTDFAAGLAKLPFSFEEVFGPLKDLQGDTRFEELHCVGYDPVKDELTAVIRVKQSTGYSGGPCSRGSLEWVAFYADLDRNGSYETHVGTTTVRVHDFTKLPSGGLEYAVVLPARLLRLRQPCESGPRLIPIRAILSWNDDPTPLGPNAVPHWGNREDTLIQIPKGRRFVHDREPFLFTVSTVSTDLIDPLTGTATGDRPFGGYLTFGGVVSNAVPGLKYRLQVKPHGAPDTAYVPLTTAVQLTVAEFGSGGFLITHPNLVSIGPASEGYFQWEEYGNRFVDGHLIGRWQTGAVEHGRRYDICLFLSVDGNPAHDMASNVVTVLIDNLVPDAGLSLTLAPGTECLHVKAGGAITGSFTAKDEHFAHYRFTLEPSGAAGGARPDPYAGWSIHSTVGASPGVQTGILDPGVSRGFTLNTTGMRPCGYALILDVYDRSIVDGGSHSNWARASGGFCLE